MLRPPEAGKIERRIAMPIIFSRRWFWITAFFAALNTCGLAVIINMIRTPDVALVVEAFEPPSVAQWFDSGGPFATSQNASTTVQGPSFRFRFSMPMVAADAADKPCEIQYVTFTPPIGGSFTWNDTRTLAFQPEQELAPATRYTATVSSEAISLLGRNISPADKPSVYYALSAYSQLPFFLILALVKLLPSLIFLIVLSFYSALLFHTGCGILTGIPRGKKLQFTLLSVLIIITSFIICSELYTLLYTEIMEQFSTFVVY